MRSRKALSKGAPLRWVKAGTAESEHSIYSLKSKALPSMTFASIMVTVDLASEASARIKIAAHLADAFEARTIGVAAHLPDHPTAQVGPMGALALMPRLSRHAAVDGLARAQNLFSAAVENRSRASWRSALEPGLVFLVDQARAGDLIVVGRGSTNGATGCPRPLDPTSVVLAAGRPVTGRTAQCATARAGLG